jgi:hypothetical protein
MAECECLPKCLFFNDKMADMPAMAESMKKRFCLGDSTHCARHMVLVAKGRENVPVDLFPNNEIRATAIISV